MTERYLTPRDAAAYLRQRVGFGAPRTLAKLRTLGGGPKFRKIGRLIVYEAAALDEWIASRLTRPLSSTSDRAEAA